MPPTRMQYRRQSELPLATASLWYRAAAFLDEGGQICRRLRGTVARWHGGLATQVDASFGHGSAPAFPVIAFRRS